MAAPARQRILDAALDLIQRKGIGRVTTREIAMAAGAAEGSLFKNFGDKMGLLTELLSYELPENQAWRAVAIEAPPGQGDLVAGLCGGALICAYIEQLAGAGQIRGGRDGLIHSLIDSAVGPHMTKDPPARLERCGE